MPKPSAPEREKERMLPATERIAREHVRMMDYVKKELGDEEHTRGPLEKMNPRLFIPQDYADMAFKPDLYVIEPAVLDDMEKARAEGDMERLEKLRHHLRAMSWAAHGRTDFDVAKHYTQKLLQEAQMEASGGTGTTKQQKGFDFASPEVSEWTRVLNTLNEIECRGGMVERPTGFVEKKIVETWKDLISQFRKKGKRSEWPTTYPVTVDPPVLSDDVKRISDHLSSLRHVRDQLYYQLLYPKHCMYAQQSKSR